MAQQSDTKDDKDPKIQGLNSTIALLTKQINIMEDKNTELLDLLDQVRKFEWGIFKRAEFEQIQKNINAALSRIRGRQI